ncbi:hypothetical protein GCM10007880_15060 [Mesorhizobium amorphae]|nr:hypothetical protein GCM10007880_15060 [Mesorhizobium amorphae]
MDADQHLAALRLGLWHVDDVKNGGTAETGELNGSHGNLAMATAADCHYLRGSDYTLISPLLTGR